MHIDDLPGARDFDLNLSGAGLARVRGLEDLCEFFEGLAGRFDEEEVDEDHFDDDPADVDDLGNVFVSREDGYGVLGRGGGLRCCIRKGGG